MDGKNLHEIEPLAAAAESVELNGEELDEVLRSKRFKTTVDQDWLRSHHLGITAVPTFRMNGKTPYGIPRATGDIDFWIRPTPKSALDLVGKW